MTRAALPAAEQERRGAPDARGTRLMGFTGQSYDASARTVEAVLSVGTRVKRWFGFEELAMDPGAIDLSRVAMGQVRLLDTHNQYEIDAVLGKVSNVRLEDGKLVGTLHFADTPRARAAEAMVAAGLLTGISIGYLVKSWRLVEFDADDNEIWQAAQWELLEVSLVSVPADPNAGVRSAAPIPGAPQVNSEEEDMTRNLPGGAPAPAIENQPASAAEQRTAPAPAAAPSAAPAADANQVRMNVTETLDFIDSASAFGPEVAAQARAWATTMTPDAARSQLLSAASAAQRTAAPLVPAMSGARITQDERDTMRSAIESALLHRYKPSNELSEPGREWRGMTLSEMARRNLEANGENTRGMTKAEVAKSAFSRMHTTSDFPAVLSAVANRTLRTGYTQAPQTFKAWMRRASVSDFRQVTRLQLGSAPSFLQVPEGGQFKMGTIGEAKEVYALATYGRLFQISRQVIINDDVDAFTRMPEMFGAAAARFESDTAYAPLIANPNMSDGVALFHATHGNLAAVAGVPSEDTVSAIEQSMGNQTGLGGEILNLEPRWMIVGRKDKNAAKKLKSAITASKTGDVNVYENSFDIVVESRLNRAAGPVPWFMAADNAQIDTIEYAYLDGEDGVFLDERAGFEVDGIEFKARLDFAAKAIDWRGLAMNAGLAAS